MIQNKTFHKWCMNNRFCANVRITLLEEHLREPCQNVLTIFQSEGHTKKCKRYSYLLRLSYSRSQQVEKMSDVIYLWETAHLLRAHLLRNSTSRLACASVIFWVRIIYSRKTNIYIYTTKCVQLLDLELWDKLSLTEQNQTALWSSLYSNKG